MKEDKQDTSGAKFIKDSSGNILVEEKQIQERWRKYFEQLLNEENPNEFDEGDKVEGPIQEVTEQDIARAVKKDKASGPPGMPSELLLVAESIGVPRNDQHMQESPERKKKDTRRKGGNSLTVPLYKGKEDALECGKYCGIRLLEHIFKILGKGPRKKSERSCPDR